MLVDGEQLYSSVYSPLPVGGDARNFHLGAIAEVVLAPSGVQGQSPGNSVRGVEEEVPQKLKQFACIVHKF